MKKEEIILLLERIKHGSTTIPSSGREWVIREQDLPSEIAVEYVERGEKAFTQAEEIALTSQNEKAL